MKNLDALLDTAIDEMAQTALRIKRERDAAVKALYSLKEHYHADDESDTAFSKDECPLCAKIDAALAKCGEPR